MELDFNELFGVALGALVEECGGSIESALDEMGIRNNEQRSAIKSWFGWDEEFLIRVHDIDYCIELEDLESNGFDTENMSDEEINAAIQKIADTLPEELTVEVECTREDLEDIVCDTISEETGWLVNGFEYDILEA